MKLDISAFIPGDPKGQPRPRAFARKMGSRHVARMYDSDVADGWKRAVDIAIRQVVIEARRAKPSEAAISVVLAFYFLRPKSHFDSKGRLRPAAPQRHTQKPDIDNLAKLVCDRVTRNGLIWRDDSQITIMTAMKFWSDTTAHGCQVTITEAGTT
jgi:Holliday junction resolvase RusA-like endonuclease